MYTTATLSPFFLCVNKLERDVGGSYKYSPARKVFCCYHCQLTANQSDVVCAHYHARRKVAQLSTLFKLESITGDVINSIRGLFLTLNC